MLTSGTWPLGSTEALIAAPRQEKIIHDETSKELERHKLSSTTVPTLSSLIAMANRRHHWDMAATYTKSSPTRDRCPLHHI
jgi:hypothetical protein